MPLSLACFHLALQKEYIHDESLQFAITTVKVVAKC